MKKIKQQARRISGKKDEPRRGSEKNPNLESDGKKKLKKREKDSEVSIL